MFLTVTKMDKLLLTNNLQDSTDLTTPALINYSNQVWLPVWRPSTGRGSALQCTMQIPLEEQLLVLWLIVPSQSFIINVNIKALWFFMLNPAKKA